MTMHVVMLVEMDNVEVSGYRGVGWYIKQQVEELDLTYVSGTGEVREYKTPDGGAVEFVITSGGEP